jgi:hypothetical protein
MLLYAARSLDPCAQALPAARTTGSVAQASFHLH